MPEEAASADAAVRSQRRLFKGMERRRGIDGAARIEIEKQLFEVLDELLTAEGATHADESVQNPPRAVAVAMAQALFVQPHLGVIFGDVAPVGTEAFEAPPLTETDRPIVMAAESLSTALGLQVWELDDIREDIDRRVGSMLKQARALRWMWNHFGLPEASCEGLFRVLFPGAPGRVGHMAMVRRGAQLYALVGQDVPPPAESLYLPWVGVDPERTLHPLRTFGGKYVNSNVRRAMGRGIGAEDDEVVQLLDRMVTVLPRHATGPWLQRDTWRARGFASLTDVPSPYAACAWLSAALAPEDVAFGSFLRKDGARLVVGDARAAFDLLAVTRVDEVIRQLYGDIFARTQHDHADSPRWTGADVAMLDLERHLKTVLKPLIDWTENPRTAAAVASRLGLTADVVGRALNDVRSQWQEQQDAAWCGVSGDGQPRSAQSLIATHLALIRNGLREVVTREPDPRAPHREVALLFSAFYLGHQPLERLWHEVMDTTTWPATARIKDPITTWFWPIWQRMLNSWEDESTNP